MTQAGIQASYLVRLFAERYTSTLSDFLLLLRLIYGYSFPVDSFYLEVQAIAAVGSRYNFLVDSFYLEVQTIAATGSRYSFLVDSFYLEVQAIAAAHSRYNFLVD